MNSSRNSFEMMCLSRFIILQSVVTRYLFVQKVVNCCLFNKNDILYGKINPQFGKVAYPGFKGLCSADIYPISCGPYIIPEFLKYVLLSYSFLKYTVALSQRSGMPKVNREEVIKYEFSLPSIIEQQKIAKSLSDMDALIAKSEKFVKKYQALKQACLQHMFPREGQTEPDVRLPGFTAPWEQRKLGELAEFNPREELPDEFEYVDLESVVGTEMISHRREAKVTAPSRAQRVAHQGDLFYQTVRPYQKNNYFFDKPDNDYVFSTGYAQMRPYIDGYFLLDLVQTERFVRIVLDNCTGTSYPAINANDLASIKVMYPQCRDEQQKIGKFLASIDNLITLHQRTCNKYKKIKQGMMEELLSGKIRLV